MSSILDALNKAEEERAAQEEVLARGFDDLDIEDELTGRTPGNGSRSQGVPLTPLRLLMLGVVFLGAIAAVSSGVAVAILYLKDAQDPTQISEAPGNSGQNLASITPTVPSRESQTNVRSALQHEEPAGSETENPESDTVSETVEPAPRPAIMSSSPTASPAEEKPEEPSLTLVTPEWESSPSKPAVSANVPAPEPIPSPETGPGSESAEPELPVPAVSSPPPRSQVAAAESARPAFVAPTPAPNSAPSYPETAEPAAPAPVKVEASTATQTAGAMVPSVSNQGPAPSQRVSPDEVDIMTLPELTESDRRRLKLPEITVNVVGRPSKYRPQPSAMINFNRVVLNDFIPGTKAQLIGVSVHGVGIQVGVERYFVPK